MNITVNLGARLYDIVICPGILNQCGQLLSSISTAKKAYIFSNPRVFKLYGQMVKDSIEASGFETVIGLMPDGEEFKNLAETKKLLQHMLASGVERGSLLIALGGGVVGDLGGFAASIFHRGIDYLHIPTTLIAQVDSSVGGKVGINFAQGKNLLGSFYQPKGVIIDPTTLLTLDYRDFCSGMGEVIKYALIFSADFFSYLENSMERLKARETAALIEIIETCCIFKKELVEQDEREQGLREALNLGHTFAHAYEELSDYKLLRHGEAVILGIIAACFISCKMGNMAEAECWRVMRIIRMLEPDIYLPGYLPSQVINVMMSDKKVKNNKIRLILPRGIGGYFVLEDPSTELLSSAIEESQILCKKYFQEGEK